MKEGRENFDGGTGVEYPASEINYSVNGQPVSTEELRQFSTASKTEYVGTLGVGAFPLEERLRLATSLEDYLVLTTELGVFYDARILALEGKQPATTTGVEVVEFAQMVQAYKEEKKAEGELASEIATVEDATEYLGQPGVLEGISGKARKLLAIAFSATAFAAATPAEAQGLGQFIGQYAVSRGVQEVQIEAQARIQVRQLKSQCDMAIQNIENNLQLQLESLQMQSNVNLSGVIPLSPDAAQRFQENNPHATPQQVAAFTRMRQIAQQTKIQVAQTVSQCQMQMQQVAQGASYSREMRIVNDIGNVITQSIPRVIGR
jgi:hypothetical protein